MENLKLVSSPNCPYVQRCAIVLEEKGAPYRRVEIDLSNPPSWFVKLSPRGRVPLLVIDGESVLFESSAIAEYLDETLDGERLHPADPTRRAEDRAWISSTSEIGGHLWQLVNANDGVDGQGALDRIRNHLVALDNTIGDGPYFRGQSFSLVDASLAPLLQHVHWVAEILPGLGLLDGVDTLSTTWMSALRARPSVRRTTPDGRVWYRDVIEGRHPLTRGRRTWLTGFTPSAEP